MHKSRWAERKEQVEFAIRLGIYAYGWGCGDRLTFEEIGNSIYVYDPVAYRVRSEYVCKASYKPNDPKIVKTIEMWDFEVHAESHTVRAIMEATIVGLKSMKVSKREEATPI